VLLLLACQYSSANALVLRRQVAAVVQTGTYSVLVAFSPRLQPVDLLARLKLLVHPCRCCCADAHPVGLVGTGLLLVVVIGLWSGLLSRWMARSS
jgi:hypothetical protein